MPAPTPITFATREDSMKWPLKLCAVFVAGVAGLATPPAQAQVAGKYLAPRDQVVAIRAGRLFDARSGAMLTNQVVLVRGDRITDVGPGLAIPSGALVIDLSNATVMPGMIDAHVHINTGGVSEAQRTLIALANAQIDLAAGFTTVLDMDSRGGYNTVDIRDQINSGRVQGPRLQVAGESLTPRATNYYPDIRTGRFQEGFIENKNVNGPWLARAAVRESKLHGVDWIKIYTTQDFVGDDLNEFKADGSLVADARGSSGDCRRGASAGAESRLSYLRWRRHALVHQRRRGSQHARHRA